MTTISILLVDDQPLVGLALRRLLASETDMAVHCCHDANAAMAEAMTLKPTLILQDLVLPGIDGLTLVGMFRANPVTARTPIVVLSLNDDAETRRRAAEAGADDYLVKLPYRADLVAAIRQHAAGAASAATIDPEVMAGFRQGPEGMAAFTVSLIDQFVIDAQARVETLRDAAARQDERGLRSSAQGLKGSSLIMGARRLGDLCDQIEAQLQRGPVSPSLIAAIDRELTQVRAALAVERARFQAAGTQ